MKSPMPQNFLLPLALIAIVAPGVAFIEPIFGYSGRWTAFAILGIYLIFIGIPMRGTGGAVPALLVAYIGWSMLTTVWSTVPILSIMKAVALALVALTAFFAGYQWTIRHQHDGGLDFLWPYAAISLIVGVWGGTPESVAVSGEFLYSGAAGGPNLMGFLAASSTPIVLWRLYCKWPVIQKRMFWGAVSLAYVIILYFTIARASYLLFAFIVLGLLAGLGAHRLILLTAVCAIAASVFLAVAPESAESLAQRNIYKNFDEADGRVLFSRERPLEESYEGAIQGGWFGLGYGASFRDTEFEGGISAIGYGREKGSTHLAIVEETGLVGLTIYLGMMFFIFNRLIRGFLAATKGPPRVMLGIVTGTVVGMLLHSVFEAWWVAPGSPEFGFFWAVVGAGVGMAGTAKTQATRHLVRPIAGSLVLAREKSE